MNGLNGSGYLPFALIFLVVVFLLVYVRQFESRRIENKFDKKKILFTSFGVNFFGLESAPGGPLRSSGVLVLLRDGLYYRARLSSRELSIRGSSITWLGVSDVFKGKPLYQQVVVISFLNDEGKEDKAAFRMPHVSQWVAAIKASLLNKNTSTRPA